MKYLLLIITMLFTLTVHAECETSTSADEVKEKLEIKTDVPKFLEGATITVTLKDGRTSTVPAEKYKVVARQQQFIVTKVENTTATLCSANVERHRVSLAAGKGTKSGLDADKSGSVATVENRVGAVFGAQYQYRTDVKVFSLPLSVGGQLQTNKTGSVLLGLDF